MIEVLCQNDPYRYVKMPDLLRMDIQTIVFKSGIIIMVTRTCTFVITLCRWKLRLRILSIQSG